MSIGKHYFHLKEYSILQLLYADTSPAYQNCRIECTHSDGNGITGIPSAVFFNEMGNKKKKIGEKKRRTNLRNSSQLHTFSFFKICKF